MKSEIDLYFRKIFEGATWFHDQFVNCPVFKISLRKINKTIGDEGITVDFRFIKVHTSN